VFAQFLRRVCENQTVFGEESDAVTIASYRDSNGAANMQGGAHQSKTRSAGWLRL